MKGTSAVQQYFAKGKSKYITPSVTAEWNYNLFYAPYTTVNGAGAAVTNSSGSLVSTEFLTIAKWSTQPSISTSGKITSAFLNDPNYSTRSCLAFPALEGVGNSKITVTMPSSTNTYKVTFYAKLDTDGIANLSALAYVDYHRSHSSSKQIDSVTWTKFEVFVSSRPVDTAYSSFDFILDYQAADSSQTYNVLVDQVRIDRTTDFEYQYGNLWPTSSPFGIFRPGESHVSSGNVLTQNSSTFRKINYNFGAQNTNGSFAVSTWDNQIMPASRVIFHPNIIGTNKLNPVYKNGSLSEFTKYKYFVAPSSTPSISALYDNVLNVNKIVIKFNLAYSTPSAFTVNMSRVVNDWTNKDQSSNSQTISLTSADIDASGTCILYLQTDGTWKSGKAGYAWSTMPSFDFNGDVKFGGATGGTTSAYKQINKITVTQTSSTVNTAYSSTVNSNIDSKKPSSNNSVSAELGRMQVVEVSPRLEVDLSYYTMSISTNEQLDNKQNPLPISAISSNMATIGLSNVPLKVSSQVLSLFSNNSTDSLLRGLFKNYVKFYINYFIKDTIAGATASEKVIRGGVYYADSWDGKDIEKTSVTAYDISKYLQILQPTDFVSKSQDVFRTISNILDFAGFSDYDYDSLKRVTSRTVGISGDRKNTTTPVEMQFFFVDGQSQKVFDVLREIFEVYQIGAYIDSYGVMKFLNIDMILDNNKKIDLLLHDNNEDQSITTALGYTNNLTVSPNIIQDTYTETVKTKVGKATIKYKTPQIKKPIAADSKLLNKELYYSDSPRYTRSTNNIWSLSDDESTTFNHLDKSMTKSQGYFLIPSIEAQGTGDVVNFNQYGIDHNGFAIIENEIVSFKEKEWAFTIFNPETKLNNNYYRYVSNSSDLEAAKAEIFNLSGINSDVTKSQATGKITSVQRGLFNTPVTDHLVLDSNNITNKFTLQSGSVSVSNSSDRQLYYLTSIKLSANSNSAVIIAKDTYTPNTYKTFSTKIGMGLHMSTPQNSNAIDLSLTEFKTMLKSGSLIPPSINSSIVAGTRAGIALHNSSGVPTVYASLQKNKNGGVDLYVTSGSPTGTSLLSTSSISVDKILIEDAINYSPSSPFSTYAKFVNLKFVKTPNSTSGNAFEIFINKTRVGLKTLSSTAPDTSGKYGLFVQSDTASTIEFSEIYATQSAINTPDYFYHYQLPWFAEKLASNKKIFEISYMAQARPEIVGISYYDVKNSFASFDAYPVKSAYDWYYYPFASLQGKPDGSKMTMSKMVVNSNSLSYSPIYHSGWRSRFAVVNNSPSQVWLKKTQDDGINKIQIEFNLVSQSVLTTGNEVTIEKIFDETGAADSVDITSNWIQDRKTAQSILRVIYRALDGFSRDTNVSVFGNPLFEIGDVVKVNYDLKNIKNQIYFVQGVEQSFQGGLSTVLVLNQIAFEKSLPSQPYINPNLSSSAQDLPAGTVTVTPQYQLSWSFGASTRVLPGKFIDGDSGIGSGDYIIFGYGIEKRYAPIGYPYSWAIYETAVKVSDPTEPVVSAPAPTTEPVVSNDLTYQMTYTYGGTPGAIEGGTLVASGSGTGSGSWIDPGYGVAKFYGIQGVPYSYRVYSIGTATATPPVTSTPIITDSITVVAPPSNGTTYSRTVGIQYNATNFSITDPTDIKVGYIITSSGGNFQSDTLVSSITNNGITTSKPILTTLSQGQSGIIFTVPTYTAAPTITAPTNIQVVGNKITWTMAPNSTSTAISVNGVLTKTTTGTLYTLTGLQPQIVYRVVLQGISPGGPIGTAATVLINAY